MRERRREKRRKVRERREEGGREAREERSCGTLPRGDREERSGDFSIEREMECRVASTPWLVIDISAKGPAQRESRRREEASGSSEQGCVL